VIRKLGVGIQPLADRVMTLLLQLIQAAGKTSTVLEDAFLVVGSLASGQNAFHWFSVLKILILLSHSAGGRICSVHPSLPAVPFPRA
jgi:hypothetical protein